MWAGADRDAVGTALAEAFLAEGQWDAAGLVARGRLALGRRARWLAPLAAALVELYRDPPRDRPREVEANVRAQLEVLEWRGRLPERPPAIRQRVVPSPEMGRCRFGVPALATTTELAAFLDLHPGELAWMADVRSLERIVAAERLRNYRYRWLPRRGAPPRLLECPKRTLKDVQRRILHQILDRVPPHEAAHGFRRGHSPLTHARRHVGRRVVLRFDLEDFFPSVRAGRVYGLFRELGYPEGVAHVLTGLSTNVVPRAEWEGVPRPSASGGLAAHRRLGERLSVPHLPQGAPTSPALASLCALGLDRRLAELAAACGAVYSRYADDLALSGDRWLLSHARGLRETVGEVVRAEGFRLNVRKSALMTSAGRQRLTGVVVNERPNLCRGDYDRLRATLHDARLHGPTAANRSGVADFRAHLLGRIAWASALNPQRGAKLRQAFDAIDWTG